MSEYNGWTNYETWAVALWIDNSQGDQEFAFGLTADRFPVDVESADREMVLSLTCRLGNDLRQWLDESLPDLGASLWADLLGAAFSKVNWFELAEHYRDDYLADPSIYSAA